MQMEVTHIRKKDLVQVMVGREKGKTGKVLKVNHKHGTVTLEKLNMKKRHTRPTGKSPGGIIESEAALRACNVLPYCEKCGRGVRTSKQILGEGDKAKKVRICRKCKNPLDK